MSKTFELVSGPNEKFPMYILQKITVADLLAVAHLPDPTIYWFLNVLRRS